MPIKRKEKGTRRENEVKKILEAEGAGVTRAAGSLGVFDLVAIYHWGTIGVEVKSGRWESIAHRVRIEVTSRNLNLPAEVWRKKNRQPWEIKHFTKAGGWKEGRFYYP